MPAALAALLALAAPALADPTIGDFDSFSQLSAQRVGRTVTQYEYQATVTNDAAAVENVTAIVTSSSPHTVIVEGDLVFGGLAAGAAGVSTDSFSFRHDLRFPFDPSVLQYQFQFDPVPVNSPPTADAGPDQTAFVGQGVTLDGSGSSDPDGDPLAFAWSLTGRPAGSLATLDDPAAVAPAFLVDRPGSYTAELIVNDGSEDSAPDSVTVDTLNSPPVADAGPDQTAFVTDTVTLDGGGSSDVDGDPLTYIWALTAVPPGSGAALDDPTAVMPRFEIDLPGRYTAELTVNDGFVDSDPDSTSVDTLNSPPVADAGPDQTVFVTDLVILDGGGSSDVDGDALTFAWALTAVPAGSTATLDDPAAVMPSFTAELPGSYVVQLVVNDGTVDSDPDTVRIDTENSPPVADAGPDQTVLVTETVTLDGSGSSDVDGDLLNFAWSLASRPPGSTAALDDAAAVRPTFVADLPGTYVAQLVVNDGTVDSAPDTVTIDTENSPPVADAGPDQTVFVTDLVTLDGSGSSDVDNDLLSYRWSFTARPAGSTAALSNGAAIQPVFEADLPGTYVLQLIVNDGTVDSAPDTVTIDTENSPPVADAGPDQTVFVTDTVALDGGGSSDIDGDPLTFAWALTGRPAGSLAALDDPGSVTPSFEADLPGTYVAQLIVNDGEFDSVPNSAVIVTENSPPIANAGPDRNVAFGATAVLDGSLSRDVDGDPLSYQWRLVGVPTGSAAALDDPASVSPSFVADVLGDYVAELTVNDGALGSLPDQVTLTADPLGSISTFSRTLGAGLQFSGASADLNIANHGGVTVRIESSDPTIALIAPDGLTPGAAAIEVFVPNGSTGTAYTMQAVAGARGAATVTASAPGFTSGQATITVVEPAVAIFALASSLPVGINDALTVLFGTPNGAGGLFSFQQASAANDPPLALTLTSSNAAAGQLSLTVGGATADTLVIPLTAGSFQPGAVFVPLAPGNTTVTASIPGFLTTTTGTVDITVTPPEFSIFARTVGAGLQISTSATLGIASHGGITVRVESSNPAVLLVAPDGATPGGAFIDVDVAAGSRSVPYTIQGVAGNSGTANLTFSAPGFADGVSVTNVVQPAVTLNGLTSTPSVGINDTFSVLLGLPNGAGTGISSLQRASAANVPPLELTVSSSNSTVGQISDGVTTTDTLVFAVPADTFQPFFTFVPLAEGSTTVTSSIPGFLTLTTGTQAVTVSP